MSDQSLLYGKLSGVAVDYFPVSGGPVSGLRGIDLDVFCGEFLSVVGASGSGKSTLLRVLAGLERPSRGRYEVYADAPRIAMVFQDNTLFPWMTVGQNLSYPLLIRGVSARERASRASATCEMIGLNPPDYLDKYPKELSGGERRRVAVGMALAHEADLLLLDEPSSALDDPNKWRFQHVIQELWARKHFTAVLVTHDIEEAVFLGDRVIHLRGGELVEAFSVSFPRPREDRLRFSPEFAELRERVFESDNSSLSRFI